MVKKETRIGALMVAERYKKMTPEERSAAAKNAADSRWGDRPRCACGEMTAARAKARGHKCASPEQRSGIARKAAAKKKAAK